jgi:hypothetical protein
MDKHKDGVKSGEKLEQVLDEALAHTFPASDPFSVGQSTGTEPPLRPADRKAPVLDVSPHSGRTKQARPGPRSSAKRRRKA